MKLSTYVQRQKGKASHKEDRRRYAEARQIFLLLFRYLRDQRRIPSPAQFNGLYLSLRWYAHVASETKKLRWRDCFPSRVVDSCARHLHEKSGIIGGAKGSISPNLIRTRDRAKLWKMLAEVAKARSSRVSDSAVIAYAHSPVSGLGRSVVSSFLWALRPDDWYPIVNGGNIDGFRLAIKGFPASNDLIEYIQGDVPCLRRFKENYDFSDFGALDRFFCLMKESLRFSEDSRFSYEPGGEIQRRIREGESIEQPVMVRKRSARARRMVLILRGPSCQVCDMTFKHDYGVDYSEVHHLRPIARTGRTFTDISKHLLVVCCNCHAMLHSWEFRDRSWKVLRAVVLARRRRDSY